jgi:F-box-like
MSRKLSAFVKRILGRGDLSYLYFSRLPNEILQEIFSYLPLEDIFILGKVNQWFYKITLEYFYERYIKQRYINIYQESELPSKRGPSRLDHLHSYFLEGEFEMDLPMVGSPSRPFVFKIFLPFTKDEPGHAFWTYLDSESRLKRWIRKVKRRMKSGRDSGQKSRQRLSEWIPEIVFHYHSEAEVWVGRIPLSTMLDICKFKPKDSTSEKVRAAIKGKLNS